jgi:glucosyl-3-phosphoglycerate synthase
VIAQVDLDKRVHRNQTTLALGRMSFGIIQTFLAKMRAAGKASFAMQLHKTMIQYELDEGSYHKRESDIVIVERPPILEIPEYLAKFPDRATDSARPGTTAVDQEGSGEA